MKRFRLGDEEIEVDINLAHVLMSISHDEYNRNISIPVNSNTSKNNNNNHIHSSSSNSCDSFKILEHPSQQVQTSSSNRMFECKTCNRQFPSFQALGGHRASHKRPKISAEQCTEVLVEPTKPRVHGCPICGLKFTIGQALGGHMRRHRPVADGYEQRELEEKNIEEESTTLCLDLNLAPPGTQWQKISSIGTPNVVHKVSSMVDCFL